MDLLQQTQNVSYYMYVHVIGLIILIL